MVLAAIWLDGRKGHSQEHISLMTNSFFNDFAFIVRHIGFYEFEILSTHEV